MSADKELPQPVTGEEGKPVIVPPLDALYDAQLKAEAALAKLGAPADGK